MAHNYEAAKKGVFKGMWLLAGVTLIEVIVSLFGKGHLGGNPASWLQVNLFGMEFSIILVIVALALIVLSLYKAYFIIYEFMHMGHEVRGLRMSVLLPTALLIWAIVAFFQEGDSWGKRRELIQEKDKIEVEETIKVQGVIDPLEKAEPKG
ncbi:MAG: cytochrome C oxidase subunit IV family protein [Bacteroidota bacterium]